MGNAASGDAAADDKRFPAAFDGSLDISEIVPRVLVCGLPYNGPTSRQSCRNNVVELAAHLDEKFGRGEWLVLNLASEERASYDPSKLHSQVAAFRPPLDEDGHSALDDGLPMVGCDLFRIVYAMDFWLRWSPDHVVLLHDVNSRSRAGAAVAAYLTWRFGDRFSDALSALDFFRQRRGLQGEARLPPTWRYSLLSFTTAVTHGLPEPPRRLLLSRLIIEMEGDVCAMREGVFVQVFESGSCLWDSEQDAHEGEFVLAGGVCRCDVDRFVSGDVLVCVTADVPVLRTPHVVPTPLGDVPNMLSVANVVDSHTTRKVLVRFAFHTNFVPPAVIPVSAERVDLPTPVMASKTGFGMQIILGAANEEPSEEGEKEWAFTNALNLRSNSHAALLAGLYFLANSHAIIPTSAGIQALTALGHRYYFAALALQLAERDVEQAAALLRTDYLQRLQAGGVPTLRGVREQEEALLSEKSASVPRGLAALHAPGTGATRGAAATGGRHRRQHDASSGTSESFEEVARLSVIDEITVPVISTVMARALAARSQQAEAQRHRVAASGSVRLTPGFFARLMGGSTAVTDAAADSSKHAPSAEQRLLEQHEICSCFLEDALAAVVPVTEAAIAFEDATRERPWASAAGAERTGAEAGAEGDPTEEVTAPASSSAAHSDGSLVAVSTPLRSPQRPPSISTPQQSARRSAQVPPPPTPRQALRPVMEAIRGSPDPLLFLAGLQLASAAKIAERKSLERPSLFAGSVPEAGRSVLASAITSSGASSAAGSGSSGVPDSKGASMTAASDLAAWKDSAQQLNVFTVTRLIEALQVLGADAPEAARHDDCDWEVVSDVDGSGGGAGMLSSGSDGAFTPFTPAEAEVTGAAKLVSPVSQSRAAAAEDELPHVSSGVSSSFQGGRAPASTASPQRADHRHCSVSAVSRMLTSAAHSHPSPARRVARLRGHPEESEGATASSRGDSDAAASATLAAASMGLTSIHAEAMLHSLSSAGDGGGDASGGGLAEGSEEEDAVVRRRAAAIRTLGVILTQDERLKLIFDVLTMELQPLLVDDGGWSGAPNGSADDELSRGNTGAGASKTDGRAGNGETFATLDAFMKGGGDGGSVTGLGGAAPHSHGEPCPICASEAAAGLRSTSTQFHHGHDHGSGHGTVRGHPTGHGTGEGHGTGNGASDGSDGARGGGGTAAGPGSASAAARTANDVANAAAKREQEEVAAAAAAEAAAKAAADAKSAEEKQAADEAVVKRFERMAKMGVPIPAVQHKMKEEKIDASLVAIVLERLGVAAEPQAPTDAPAGAAQEQPPAKYKEQLAAEQKQREADAAAAARSERIRLLREEQVQLVAEAKAPVGDHRLYSRFFRMLRMGVPVDVVQSKLIAAGLEPGVALADPAAPLPGAAERLVAMKDDELYGKFFRMLKVGLPRDVVEHKMALEGAAALGLELDPSLPVPPSLGAQAEVLGGGARAGSAQVPRRQRKRLHWEALPGDRVKDSSLWAAGAGGAFGGGVGSGDGLEDLIDDDEFEALFTQDAAQGKALASVVKATPKAGADGGGDGAGSRVVQHLTADTKRERNVGIGLAKLRLPPETIRRVLLGLTYRVEVPVPPPAASAAASHAASAEGDHPPGTAAAAAATTTVIELDWEQLSLLEDLLPNPDSDEVSRAKAFRGSVARLSEAGKFWVAISDVPKARARASALAYQRQFDARTADAQARLACVVRACSQVRTSPRLRRVLLAIRQLGNKLNASDEGGSGGGGGAPGSASKGGGSGGGSGGSVVAFRLESLLKLSHTKAFNAKTTVLHFLVSQLARRDADCLLLAQDMPDAAPASRLSLEAVRGDVTALKQGLLTVEKLVREQAKLGGGWGRLRGGSAVAVAVSAASASPPPAAAASAASPDASAVAAAADAALSGSGDAATSPPPQQLLPGEALADFVGRAQQQLEALQAGVDACRADYSAVLEYLAEDPSMAVDAFFSILSSFLAALRRAQAENAEEETRRARELKRQQSSISSSSRTLGAPPGASGASGGIVAAAGQDTSSVLATPGADDGSGGGRGGLPFLSAIAAAASARGAAASALSAAAVGSASAASAAPPPGVPAAPPAAPLAEAAPTAEPGGRPGLAALLAGRSLLRPRPVMPTAAAATALPLTLEPGDGGEAAAAGGGTAAGTALAVPAVPESPAAASARRLEFSPP